MVRPLGAQSVGQALAAFLRTPRYEIFPTDDVLERVATNVPHEVTITVTASPRRGMPTTIRLAVSLAQLGYRVVPHLSARLIRDHVEVGQIIEALQAAGIRNVFVVAGDAPTRRSFSRLGLSLERAAAGSRPDRDRRDGLPREPPVHSR